MEHDHSKLHRVINVLVQNSIEWYIARYTNLIARRTSEG